MANSERLTVQDESVVTMEYRVTLDNGEVVEASDEDGPMQFIKGAATYTRPSRRPLAASRPETKRTCCCRPKKRSAHMTPTQPRRSPSTSSQTIWS